MSSQAVSSWLEAEQVGDVTVVRFTRPVLLTGEQAEDFGKETAVLIHPPGRRWLLLNFANVQSFASMTIAKVLGLQRKVEADGGRLALCALNPDLREVFHVTRVDRLVSIYPTEAEAVQSFPGLAGGRPD